MKTLIALLITASAAFAQATVVYTYTLQPNVTQVASTVSVTQDLAVSEQNYLFKQMQPGTTPANLTAGVTSSATVLPLSSVAGIAVGNGICISTAQPAPVAAPPLPSSTYIPPSTMTPFSCAMSANTSMTVTGGEIALVTAISGNNVTVTRGSIGTAAAYLVNQQISVVQSGSYNELLANVVRAWGQALLQNPAYGSASALAAQAATAAAQATLATNAQVAH